MKKKILAISSGGGHWVELLRISPAFTGADVIYATVEKSYQGTLADIEYSAFFTFADVTRWNRLKWIVTALQIFLLLVRVRPDVVISTGALPGYMAIRLGKVFGARTIWVDSIANAHELSASGKHVRKFTDLYLTQWEHLARDEGPFFKGAVL